MARASLLHANSSPTSFHYHALHFLNLLSGCYLWILSHFVFT